METDTDQLSTHTQFVELIGDSRFLSVMLIAMTVPMSAPMIAPALPRMATSLGVSDARIGLVVTAITLPAMVLAPVIGIASDIYGRRLVAILGLTLFGVAGVAITFVENFSYILVFRGMQGIAMAGIGPLMVTLLGDFYTGTLGTTAQGFRSSVSGISATLIPVLAGWLAGIAWEYPFYLYGFAVFVMLIVFRYLPETSQGIDTGSNFQFTLAEYIGSIKYELVDSSLIIVMFGGFVRFFSLFAFITFVPIFAVRSLGATPFEAGLVLATRGIRILLSPMAGWWVSRFSRKSTLVGTLAILTTSFGLIPFAPDIRWLAGLTVLHGVGDSTIDPVVNDAVATKVRAENRNGIVGALRVLKEAGKTAAPIVLGGVLAVSGYVPLFLTAATVLACYAIAVVLLIERYW
jgi:MFS family permease